MSIIILVAFKINFHFSNFLFIVNNTLKLTNYFIKEEFINQFMDCLNLVILDYV